MADARNTVSPKFQLTRTQDCIALAREGLYLMRIFPRTLQFQLDRLEQGSKVQEEYQMAVKGSKFGKKVYGVFGYIKLACYRYIILIEEATVVGQILKADIFKVTKLMFLPLRNDSSRMIASEDQPFIDMIANIQREQAFYFSYDMDLTRNIQQTLLQIQNHGNQIHRSGMDVNTQNYLLTKESFPNSIDFIPQYAFNDNLLSEFQGIEYAAFKIPCILGYVYISSPNFSRSKVEFILISRKDCRRPGRRFVTRGLDREGNAANFVETENIFIQYESQTKIQIATYVQIRGSIPLLWSMKPNLKWSPPVIINENFEDSRIAAEMHFKETVDMYGPQYLVNLIDKKGSQLRIGSQFTKLHTELRDKRLQYVWFDFHGECKNMKWENLSRLVDICRDELQNYGYFMANLSVGFTEREQFNNPRNFTILQIQKGTFRSNCMDCLDRTNVVQGVFCRFVAHNQLNRMDLVDLPSGGLKSPFEKFPDALEEAFREGWTNNADIMSYLYTGTPALKTDFTRTGKRTYQGAINDGINAVTRYYINNFTDGYYHDCLDISTLKLQPSSYLKPRGTLTPLKMSIAFCLLLSYFCKSICDSYFVPDDPSTISLKQYIVHKTIIAGSFILGLAIIVKNGRNFIDDASRFV